MLRKEFVEKLNFHCKIDGKEVWVNIMPLIKTLFDEHEAQMKAKDEEIERLNCRVYHAEGYINDLHNHPTDKKFYDTKARSIVAMLFWEWRKAETRYQTEWKTKRDNRQLSLLSISSYKSELLFKQALKMLKDKA